MSKSGLIIIQPLTFRGPSLVPGHKKDIFIISEYLKQNSIGVINLYLRGLVLYRPDGAKYNFTLIDILFFGAHKEKYILFSPLYKFRFILIFLFWKNCFFYVADSVLKTSFFSFIHNPLLIHRVFFNFFAEKLLKRHFIIVASIDEYIWFTSSGFHIDRVFVVPPTPLIESSMISDANLSFTKPIIFFYNPSGQGIQLADEIIKKIYSKYADSYDLVISGPSSIPIREKYQNYKSLHALEFVDNVESLICKSYAVVLTDIGGSGVCNRALQIRKLNALLISTLDGLRGTSLIHDPGVLIFQNSTMAIELLEFSRFKNKDEQNSILSTYLATSERLLKLFVNRCFVH